jgi:hypothetical protein
VAKHLCVVLDTNQWDSHTLLRSHLSASLVFLIEQRDGRLGLPPIVRIELERHLIASYEKAVAEIDGNLSRMRMILGRAPSPEFADSASVSEAVTDRLSELGSLLYEPPLDAEHYVEAGRMVIEERAPNKKGSQQFKDSLLWRCLLDLLGAYDVLFVSADNGFYEDSKRTDLHPALQAEVEALGGEVVAVRSMEAAVALLQSDAPQVDLGPIMSKIDDWLRPQLVDLANRQLGLLAGGWTSYDGQTFVTGRPGEAVVTFSLRHDLLDPTDEDLPVVGFAKSSGEVIASLSTSDVRDFSLTGIDFERFGLEKVGGLTVVRAGTAFAGSRFRDHELRVPAPAPIPTDWNSSSAE